MLLHPVRDGPLPSSVAVRVQRDVFLKTSIRCSQRHKVLPPSWYEVSHREHYKCITICRRRGGEPASLRDGPMLGFRPYVMIFLKVSSPLVKTLTKLSDNHAIERSSEKRIEILNKNRTIIARHTRRLKAWRDNGVSMLLTSGADENELEHWRAKFGRCQLPPNKMRAQPTISDALVKRCPASWR